MDQSIFSFKEKLGWIQKELRGIEKKVIWAELRVVKDEDGCFFKVEIIKIWNKKAKLI